MRRNGSSLIAFVRGRGAPEEAGLRLVGAHTDSPVSYTHPTLPTSDLVEISVAAVSLKKKNTPNKKVEQRLPARKSDIKLTH